MRSLGVVYYVSVRVTKITSKIGASWTHSLPFYFLPLFWLSGMAILSKARKPDNFELHNSLKLNFTNTRRLYSNSVECKSFLESSSPDILVLWEKFGCWMTQSILQFLCEGLSSFNPKGFCYSHTWPCSLCKGGCWGCGGSFCTGLFSRKLCGFLLFSTGFTPFSFLLLFPLNPFFFFEQFLLLYHLTKIRFSKSTHL